MSEAEVGRNSGSDKIYIAPVYSLRPQPRHIGGWLLHVLAEKVSFEVLC